MHLAPVFMASRNYTRLCGNLVRSFKIRSFVIVFRLQAPTATERATLHVGYVSAMLVGQAWLVPRELSLSDVSNQDSLKSVQVSYY